MTTKIYGFIIVLSSVSVFFIFQNCSPLRSGTDSKPNTVINNNVKNMNSDSISTQIYNLMVQAGVPTSTPSDVIGGSEFKADSMTCGASSTNPPTFQCKFYLGTTVYQTTTSDDSVRQHLISLGATQSDPALIGYDSATINQVICGAAVVPNPIARCTYLE